MHKVKFFTVNMYNISERDRFTTIEDLSIEVNGWLLESKSRFNALVIQRTDMLEICGMLIYSIYYTYLPNDTEKDNQTGGEPEKSSPEAATIGAR